MKIASLMIALAGVTLAHADSPWPHDPAFGLTAAQMDQPVTVDPGPEVAKWIQVADTRTKDNAFKKTFVLGADPGSVMLYLSIDPPPELWVNGQKIRDESPGMPWARHFVKAFDITPFCKEGDNRLAIAFHANSPGAAHFAMLVDAIDVTGRRQKIGTDSSWSGSSATPVDGWQNQAGPSSDGWSPAQELGPVGGPTEETFCYWPERMPDAPELRQLAVPPTALLRQLTTAGRIDHADAWVTGQDGPAVFHVPGNALANWRAGSARDTGSRLAREETLSPSVLLDFGREVNGRLRLTSASGQPMIALVSLGESPGEAINSGSYVPLQRVYLPPHGESSTTLVGFRYANIFPMPLTGASMDPVALALGPVVCDFIHDPVGYQGSFECSDATLNQIWWMSAYTIRLNMQWAALDGDKRDRGIDSGDLIPRIATHEHVFAENAQTHKTLIELGMGGPNQGHIKGIPGYTVLEMELALEDYQYTGDPSFIRAHRLYFTRAFNLMRRELDDRHVFTPRGGGWPFIDWAPGLSGFKITPDQTAAMQMIYVGGFQILAQIFDLLGDDEAKSLAAQSRTLAQQFRAAAQTNFWDATLNAFGPRHQVNALALRYGVARPEQVQSIVTNILKAPWAPLSGQPGEQSVGTQDRATPYFQYFILQEILRAGQPGYCINFIKSYWGEMIKRGATTTWEQFDPADKSAGDLRDHLGPDWQRNYLGYAFSDCHGWSAGPADLLNQAVLGFRSMAAGETKIQLFPSLADLTYAKGQLALHPGPLDLSYRQSPTSFTATLELPAGCSGELGIPKRDWKQATFVQDQKPLTLTRETADRWIFALAAGAPTTIQATKGP